MVLRKVKLKFGNFLVGTFSEVPLKTEEKEMETHSSVLVWRIPWPRSLVGYSPWGRKESDTTEQLTHTHTKD